MSDGLPPRGGSRRESREAALSLLYESDVRGEPPQMTLARQALTPEPYSERLVEGVGEHMDDIDEIISADLDGWTIERLPTMDRALLRLATFELGHCPDVPAAVIIDEAVRLAGDYSTGDSSRFVNGVLGSVNVRLRGG